MQTGRDSAGSHRQAIHSPTPGRVQRDEQLNRRASKATPIAIGPTPSEATTNTATGVTPPSGPRPSATLVGAALMGSGGATVSTVIALHGPWQAALAMSIVTVLVSAAFSLTHVLLGFVECRRIADQRHTENILRLHLEASLNRNEQDVHATLATQNAALQAAVIQKITAGSPMADAPDAILAVRGERTLDRPPR